MRLNFAFNNIVTNLLLEFLKQEFIEQFRDFKTESGFATQETLDSTIELFDSTLPGLENEILQVIETTDQQTIDSYFKLLQSRTESLTEHFNDDVIGKAYSIFGKTENFLGDFSALAKIQHAKFIKVVQKYLDDYKAGKIKSKHKESVVNKPVLFVEGEQDIRFLKRAAELLGKENVLAKVEIRQRGGYKNLDKLWAILKESSWETVPQMKLFLYDCDTEKIHEDFGVMYKRIIPLQGKNKITRGIENMFPDNFIEKAEHANKAFIDIKIETGRERGVDFKKTSFLVNKDEKTNFCDWACKNGTKDDFINFEIIFSIVEKIVN